jgi:predicted alpha/beta superfamily hydrolase
MFWRTKEQLKFDRDLGPFKLPPPKEDYPVDYVLDGQQRVTSISVFSRPT